MRKLLVLCVLLVGCASAPNPQVSAETKKTKKGSEWKGAPVVDGALPPSFVDHRVDLSMCNSVTFTNIKSFEISYVSGDKGPKIVAYSPGEAVCAVYAK